MALAAEQDYLPANGSEAVEDTTVNAGKMSIAFKQREAIRLAACGIPYLTISRTLHWGPAAVHEFLTSRIAQAQMRALSEQRDLTAADIACTIQELAPGAMAYLEEVLHGEAHDPKLRTKVAHDLLDRAGHAPVKRTVTMDVPLAGGVLEDIKRHAREAGILASEPVETAVERSDTGECATPPDAAADTKLERSDLPLSLSLELSTPQEAATCST